MPPAHLSPDGQSVESHLQAPPLQVWYSGQIERFPAFLWDAGLCCADQVHGQIDRRLAGALDVEHDRVLPGEVSLQVAAGRSVFLARSLDTPLDDGGLVDNHVIHKRSRARELPA